MSRPINVTVFGATGGVGTHAVAALRKDGHRVTAFVRNPSKVPAEWPEDVTVVVGELSDITAVEQAVVGADAVVSTLGPSLDRKAAGLPLVEGTRNIVGAMQSHGVRRYVDNGTAFSTRRSTRRGRRACRRSWRRRSCAAPTPSS